MARCERFRMPLRSVAYLGMATFSICLPAMAQLAEPILTWNAVPNPAGSVSIKSDFVSPIGQTTGASAQAIPETRMEVGLGRGFETVLQMPLLRISEPNGSSVLAGGQFSVALRYLLAGSLSAKYAISVSGRLEVPSGDSTIVGNFTQLMPMVLAEWHAAERMLLWSNIAWNTTIGSGPGRFANFEHAHAVAWLVNRHFTPVLEFAGSTNTLNGNTQFVIQPEAIFTPNPHIELKTGLAVALMPTPHYGIRSQVAWYWGKRQLR
jgi:hypothetical protein